MTEAIAYRLKQIMTAEHLSLTQAAKLIGISPSSMRKVLKDTPMSRPIMFKINRFIEAHPVAPAEHTFTIFDSEAAEKNATPTQPGAKPAAAAKPDAPQPAAKQTSAQPDASQAKRQVTQPKQAKAERKDATQAKQAAKTQNQAENKGTKAQAKQAAKTQAKAENKDTKAQPKQAAKTQAKGDQTPATKAQSKQAAKTQAKGDQTPATKAQAKQSKAESKTATQPKQAKTQAAKPNDQPKAAKTQSKQAKAGQPIQAKQAPATAAAPKQQAQSEQPKANRNAAQQAPKNPVGSLEPGAQQANFEATRKAQLADQTPAKTAPAAVEQATAQPTPAADTKRKPGRPKSTKTEKAGDQAKRQGNKQNEQAKQQQQAAKQNDQPKQQQAAKQNDQPKQQQAAKQNEQPKQQQAAKQNDQPKQQQAAKQNDQPKQQQAAKQNDQAKQQQTAKQNDQPKQQQAAKQNDQPKQQQAAKQNDQPKQQQAAKQNEQSTQPQQQAKPATKPRPSSTTLQVFMDESFGGGSDYQRNMSIGATVIDPADDHALDSFTNTLYPFGWQPGDEVKARGKSSAQIQAMMAQALDPAVKVYTVYSPLSDAGNFSMSFGVMYPYVAALLRIIDAQAVLPQKVRVTLDQRSEIATEQLGLAARMLHAYLKSQTGREISFFFRTADSKNTIGVQYSDFASHAAMFFTAAQMQTAGMVRLADIGAELGDQLTLYAMVGLQKYLLDERPTAVVPTSGFKSPVLNIAMRLFNLASKAATMTQVPEDAFVQAKLVINQLLTITPSSVNGAINKMPFQNWYDMAARASSLLHYTDATLPQFSIDPDALKVAEDALNNVATLLAGGR
ncbi:hypothetical protein [Lacticaseibacillus parakribbianus]|uniref:hypothetical protein n=1 Tax=Lacticaseibacillus parakribbianus TaxID=2970927 RepID=UPI0021CAED1B|nr:hypothetical protein [Lacticaseibacillus parakribbianus]